MARACACACDCVAGREPKGVDVVVDDKPETNCTRETPTLGADAVDELKTFIDAALAAREPATKRVSGELAEETVALISLSVCKSAIFPVVPIT